MDCVQTTPINLGAYCAAQYNGLRWARNANMFTSLTSQQPLSLRLSLQTRERIARYTGYDTSRINSTRRAHFTTARHALVPPPFHRRTCMTTHIFTVSTAPHLPQTMSAPGHPSVF